MNKRKGLNLEELLRQLGYEACDPSTAQTAAEEFQRALGDTHFIALVDSGNSQLCVGQGPTQAVMHLILEFLYNMSIKDEHSRDLVVASIAFLLEELGGAPAVAKARDTFKLSLRFGATAEVTNKEATKGMSRNEAKLLMAELAKFEKF